MKVRLWFPKEASLHEMFNGATGEIISSTELHAYVRIELEEHTEYNPSTALILAVWDHIEITG
ncbi:MAG TPA: hypothetical protein VN372_00055 [Methanospirillum sp.]|nr:hypothetical protein [Methanospirillum sp.]